MKEIDNKGKKSRTHDGYKKPYIESNPAKIKKFLNLVAKGYKYNTCCELARISQTAFYGWKKRGKADFEAEIDSIYAGFYCDLVANNSRAEVRLLDKVKNSKDWKASAWILEYRFDYSKVDNRDNPENKKTETLEDVKGKIAELRANLKGRKKK